jgi:hypothetical protein
VLPPFFKERPVVDGRGGAREPLVIKIVDDLIFDEQVALPAFGFEGADLFDELAVLHEELDARAARPVAHHERVVDEQLPRRRGIDRAVMHGAPWHNLQAVERDGLERCDVRGLRLPVRLGVRLLRQVRS